MKTQPSMNLLYIICFLYNIYLLYWSSGSYVSQLVDTWPDSALANVLNPFFYMGISKCPNLLKPLYKKKYYVIIKLCSSEYEMFILFKTIHVTWVKETHKIELVWMFITIFWLMFSSARTRAFLFTVRCSWDQEKYVIVYI